MRAKGIRGFRVISSLRGQNQAFEAKVSDSLYSWHIICKRCSLKLVGMM